MRKIEWPAMARGKPSHHASDDLEALSTAVFQVQPQGFQQHALYQNALRLLTVIADNRGERLDSADGSVTAACAPLDFTGDEKISVLPFEEALEQMPTALPSH